MAEVVRLRPMTQDEFDAFRERLQREYAEEIAASGTLDLDAALERSAEQLAERLPDGLASPGMHLWTVETVDTAERVGLGWIEVRRRASDVSAWVYDVEVDEGRRGQGLGRATMVALHDAARELGATTIGLNVFGHNTTARRLYDSMGYAVTAQQMKRDL